MKPVPSGPSIMAEPFLESLSTDLASLLFNETDTDFMLLASNGERLPIHPFLLKARSPFFHDLLSSRMEKGREARLDVGKEVLSLIITFLYTGKAEIPDRKVELLFEMLETAEMMSITDLAEGIKGYILSTVNQSKRRNAAEVFMLLNLGMNKLPDVVQACLAWTERYLNLDLMEWCMAREWLKVSSQIHVLSPISLKTILTKMDARSAAKIISFGVREGFWQGREEDVFEQIGQAVKDESLERLVIEDLKSMLGHARGQELRSRVIKALDAREENNFRLENELELETEKWFSLIADAKEEQNRERKEREEWLRECKEGRNQHIGDLQGDRQGTSHQYQ